MLASDIDKYDTKIHEWDSKVSEDDFSKVLSDPKYKAFMILNTAQVADNSDLETNVDQVISILRDYPAGKPRKVLCYYEKGSEVKTSSAYNGILEKLDKAIKCLEKQCNFSWPVPYEKYLNSAISEGLDEVNAKWVARTIEIINSHVPLFGAKRIISQSIDTYDSLDDNKKQIVNKILKKHKAFSHFMRARDRKN